MQCPVPSAAEVRKSLCLEAGTPRNELALVGRTTRPRSPFVPSSAPVPKSCSCTSDSARAPPAAACRAAGPNGTARAGACRPVAVPQPTLLNNIPSFPTRPVPRPDAAEHARTLRTRTHRPHAGRGKRSGTVRAPALRQQPLRRGAPTEPSRFIEVRASSVPERRENARLFRGTPIRAVARERYSTSALAGSPSASSAQPARVYFRQHARCVLATGTSVSRISDVHYGMLPGIIAEGAARHQQASISAAWPSRTAAAIFCNRHRLRGESRGLRRRGGPPPG